MQTARRVEWMTLSTFNALKEKARQWEEKTGLSVIDFSLGSPDIPPAHDVMETLSQAALLAQNYRYAVNPLPQLIAQIQTWYKERYQVDLKENQICLLQGSQEALMNFPLLYCNPGDGVLIPNPYYPAYKDAPLLASAEVLYMPLLEENGWLPDLDAIPAAQRKQAKLMIVCYPNNPTGAAAPDWFVEKLISFAKENDILILYDSAYSDLVFAGKPGRSFLSYPHASEVGVELNSFSKSYGMAGARLGVLAGSEQIIAQYKMLKSNLDYGIFLPVQMAGVTALQTGASIVEKTRQTYLRRRALLEKTFTEAGWNITLPAATMFVWAAIPEGFENAQQFAACLLEKTGILVTPGETFGTQGARHVRLALVVDEQQIEQAGKRLKSFFSHPES